MMIEMGFRLLMVTVAIVIAKNTVHNVDGIKRLNEKKWMSA